MNLFPWIRKPVAPAPVPVPAPLKSTAAPRAANDSATAGADENDEMGPEFSSSVSTYARDVVKGFVTFCNWHFLS